MNNVDGGQPTVEKIHTNSWPSNSSSENHPEYGNICYMWLNKFQNWTLISACKCAVQVFPTQPFCVQSCIQVVFFGTELGDPNIAVNNIYEKVDSLLFILKYCVLWKQKKSSRYYCSPGLCLGQRFLKPVKDLTHF